MDCSAKSSISLPSLRLIFCSRVLLGARSSFCQEAQRSRAQTQTLIELMNSLASSNSTEAIIKQIINTGYKLISANRIAFFLLKDDEKTSEKQLICQVSRDAEGLRMPITRGLPVCSFVISDAIVVFFYSGIAGYVASVGQAVNVCLSSSLTVVCF